MFEISNVFRSRPSSLYTFENSHRSANPVWLGVVSEEFADFERIPQAVSHPAAQGFYPKSAVSANSTIIPCFARILRVHLLLVMFDGVGRAHVRDVGILSGVTTRAALP
jgi:hypothetical protein